MMQPDELNGLNDEQRRQLLQQLLQKRVAESTRFPMSVQQQGLWYDFRRDPFANAFNVYLPARVRSEINVDALQQTIDSIVQRHDCLRTTFSDKGGVLTQQVHASLPPEFRVIAVPDQSDEALRAMIQEEVRRPIDLEQGPMFRFTLFRRSTNHWISLALTHHIVVDFWSLVLLLSETREIYKGIVSQHPATLPPAANHYAAFVAQQRKTIEGDQGQRLRRYWRQQLAGSSHVTELPTDYIRPERFSRRADSASLSLGPDVVEQMAALASRCGATLQALVLAVLQTMIHRYTGQTIFHIGSPFTGRLHRQYEQTVGFFVNMLPLRADLTGEPTFEQLIDRVSRTMMDALDHEDLPLAEIVRESGVARDASRSPLFQVSCTFEKSHRRQEQGRAGYLLPGQIQRTKFAGLEQESFSVPVETCHYDMEFVFERSDQGLQGMVCCCRDLFAQATIATFARHFEQLATQLVQQANRPIANVSWQPPANRRSANKRSTPDTSAADNPFPGISPAVANVARAAPAQIALSSAADNQPDQQSYSDLDVAASKIAAALASRGIGPGVYVPVIGYRGPHVVAALLGVIRSGATVVPIDAAQPAVQMVDLIEDTQSPMVIVATAPYTTALATTVPQAIHEWTTGVESATVAQLTVAQLLAAGEEFDDQPDSLATLDTASRDPEQLGYLIYTSGSSGRPKGVMVTHRAIENTLQWRCETVPVTPDDRVLMLLSHQFDAGFGILLSSLVQGAELVWMDQPASNIDAVIDCILAKSITVLPGIPSLLALVIHHPRFAECTSLRQLWSGGEAMPPDLPAQLRAHRSIPLWNFYGPTEAAIEATAINVLQHDARRIVPIGSPVRATEILVLDENGQPVPPTVPGELAICGPGLANGYLGRSGLTAQRFVKLADGRRVFLTGDRGRQRVDGLFEFLGRTDNQVKLGGYRIELEEIELVLQGCPLVASAAIQLRQAGTSAAALVAYLTLASSSSHWTHRAEPTDEANTLHAIQSYVAARLPTYKRPRRYQILDHMPRTSSGKVDRQRLPELPDHCETAPQLVPPRTPLEQYVANAWSQMLDVSPIGIHQDFFECGGTSLQAAMLAAQMSDDLGVHVPTSLLFDLADVSRMTQRLASLYSDPLAERFGNDSISIYGSAIPLEESLPNESNHPLIATFRASELAAEATSATPIFMIHPPGGIVACYRELASACPGDQPFYAIRSRGLYGEEGLPETTEKMAADYVAAIQSVRPHGPYQIGGWSLGGIVAYEVAAQLCDAGETVERLILLDTSLPENAYDSSDTAPNRVGLEYGLDMTLEELVQLNPEEQLPLLWEHAKKLGVLADDTPQEIVDRMLNDLKSLFHHHIDVIGRYRLRPLRVPVLLIRPRDVPIDAGTSADRGWAGMLGELEVAFVSGHHHSMVRSPHANEIVALLTT